VQIFETAPRGAVLLLRMCRVVTNGLCWLLIFAPRASN